jgi:hypothetical protein
MSKARDIILFIIIVCILSLSGCASKRPVLYPNDYLDKIGKEQAEADIEECMRLATEYGVEGDAGATVVKNTAITAAVGAAAAAAVAAVFGGDVGLSAAAGALGGGTASLARRAITEENPTPAFRNSVDKCLREKGYEPIDWG